MSLSKRGVTLIELMIVMVITSIIMVGVIGVSMSQQNAYQGGNREREAQGATRYALLQLERTVRMAGYGVDPAFALDFGTWYAQSGGTETFDSSLCPGPMGTCPRDSTANTDELVFYTRNPNYWICAGSSGVACPSLIPAGHAWTLTGPPTGTAPGPYTVTLTSQTGNSIQKGQILEAVCPGGKWYALFTVTNNVAASDGGAQSVSIGSTVAGDPFQQPSTMDATQFKAPQSCFTTGAPIFQIDRYRYHVVPIDAGAPYTVPYLMLDMGIDRNGDNVVNSLDEIPIAAGIEDMQIAYGFENRSLGWAGQTAGTAITTSTAETNGTLGSWTGSNNITATAFQTITGFTNPSGVAPYSPYSNSVGGTTYYQPMSWFQWSTTNALPNNGTASCAIANDARCTDNQANIDSITIALVGRSTTPDPTGTATILMNSGFSLFNQNAIPNWILNNPTRGSGNDGYKRVVTQATFPLPNAWSRAVTSY